MSLAPGGTVSRFTSFALILLSLAACAPADLAYGPWPVSLDRPPEGMSHEAWVHGLAAHEQAQAAGLTDRSLVAIIDYSRPATERRLWVLDLATGVVLMHEHVAHAARTGGTWATSFSNAVGSYQSSLGTFITANSYLGVRGLSLRLRGIEPGINDNALRRGIVIHGTPNVTEARARAGRQGRTEGCPAVPMEAARRLVRLIEGGVVVFAWYPDRTFLARSSYLDHGQAAIRLSSSN
jgi:hypothetical protein